MLRGSPGIALFTVRLRNRPAASSGRYLFNRSPPPRASPSLSSATTDLPIDSRQLSLHQFIRMRKAVDSISQDLLDLSSFLKVANAQRQHLLNQSNNLQQLIKRGKANSAMQARQHDIKSYIKMLDGKIRGARQNEIPTSSYFIHLKRLHGRLPLENRRYRNSPAYSPEVSRQVTSALKALLALPNALLLEELARFLLTAPLPLSEESVFIIIRRLSSLRLASAARSVYHNFMATGYYPASASSISVLLKITISAQLRTEFRGLEDLLGSLKLPSDEYVHSGLIVGNLKFNCKDIALGQLSKMIFSGYEPNLQVLTALLDYSASKRQWKFGCQIWRAIREGKKKGRFEIDAWAYHVMWRLCTKCYQRQIASQILREAVHEGYHVEEVIHHRRMKYKSLPVRNSNKTPVVQDVLHSFKSLSAKKDPIVSASTSSSRSSLLTKLQERIRTSSKRLKSANAQPKPLPSLSHFVQARWKVDALYLSKTRKLSNPLSNHIPLNEPEIPLPAKRYPYSPCISAYIFNLDEEMLRDAIQESTAIETSHWFSVADEIEPFVKESKAGVFPFRDPIPSLRDNYVATRISTQRRLLFRRMKLKRVVL